MRAAHESENEPAACMALTSAHVHLLQKLKPEYAGAAKDLESYEPKVVLAKVRDDCVVFGRTGAPWMRRHARA